MTRIRAQGDYISIIELSQMLCVPQTVIVEWIEHEVIYARLENNIYYVVADDIARAKSARRLMSDLGVNSSGVSIILNLREKINQLEALLNQQHHHGV